jgi:hypothetical protein
MGRITFTVPQDSVRPCIFLALLVLTSWHRVLDSIPVLDSAYCRGLCFHVDNSSIQHRDLYHTLSLLEGVYHYNWVAHIRAE